MKTLQGIFCSLIIVLTLVSHSSATLIDNNDGTVTQIRDDGSRLMWLKDANFAKTSGYDLDGVMSWEQANDWASYLNITKYAGYDNWRLPATVDGLWEEGYDGTTTGGWNIITSEMGYMYYVELAAKGYYDTAGNMISSYGVRNPSFAFENLQAYTYWSGTRYSRSSIGLWDFSFIQGCKTLLEIIIVPSFLGCT